jgi:hypothetical protein
MTAQEFAEVVVLGITARWPHPAIASDEHAIRALQEDVGHLDAESVRQAIRRLVTDGERFQPRGPAILAALADLGREERMMRRALEAEDRQAQRRRELTTGADRDTSGVAEVREVLARLRRGAELPS